MSMFKVSGRLAKVYRQKRVDRETGEQTTETRCNILGEIPTRDGGDTRLDLQDIRVPDDLASTLTKLEGQDVNLPVGLFAPAKGQIVVFIPKGSKVNHA